MKLARPDIRHPRIVLAGSPGGDDADLVAALVANDYVTGEIVIADGGLNLT